MKKAFKRYDYTQCALYKCTNKRLLEQRLGLQKYDLNHIKKAVEYHSFEIDKKGTTEKRQITAPAWTIKQVQASILKFLQPLYRPSWLISGEKGKSYIQNGEAHIDANYMLAVDIKKFYDNCQREYVYRFFVDYLKTSRDVAGVLCDIVTHNGGIPTGCPTSQIIAYYAYRNLFEEIYQLAKSYGCIFTLYVDDMTFSSDIYFNHQRLANQIDILLRKYGHKPKYKKVKYYPPEKDKPVTGTIVTSEHRLDVPNNLQKKVYDNFQSVKHVIDSEIPKIEDSEEKVILALKGQLHAVNGIDNTRFPEINRLAQQLPTTVRVAKAKRKRHKRKVVIPHKLAGAKEANT